jgi:hypothetical protein
LNSLLPDGSKDKERELMKTAHSRLQPMYIAEISPPAIRGRLIGLYEAGWQTGAVVGKDSRSLREVSEM